MQARDPLESDQESIDSDRLVNGPRNRNVIHSRHAQNFVKVGNSGSLEVNWEESKDITPKKRAMIPSDVKFHQHTNGNPLVRPGHRHLKLAKLQLSSEQDSHAFDNIGSTKG